MYGAYGAAAYDAYGAAAYDAYGAAAYEARAINGVGAAAATIGAAANGVAIGVAMAWLIVCALYDEAYGKILPKAAEQNMAKTTKIWNYSEFILVFHANF